MTDRNARARPVAKRSELMTAYAEYREDELLDAVVTAAALVGRSDGRISAVERGQLVDYLDREQFLSVFTRTEVLDAFESRVRQLAEAGGPEAAVEGLRQIAGRPMAGVVIGAGREVAAADGRVKASEQDALQLIQEALGRPEAGPSQSRS